MNRQDIHKKTIVLLVEDNPADAVLIKEYFKDGMLDKAELVWADRISSAASLLDKGNIEAILLDLNLPDSKGIDTFERIHNKTPNIPIIILTGFEDHDLATKAVRSGAQDFLVKGLVDSGALRKSINYAIERKVALEALQESQRTLSTLMKNLPGMAYKCQNDRNWTMKFVSEGATKLTGYPPQDLIDNKSVSFSNLIHKEDIERVWKDVQSSLDSGNVFRLIYRITTKNNIVKWVWEQGCGVYDDTGKLVALEGFITDISEQVEYQNKLRKFSAAVNQAANMICITSIEGMVEYVNPAFVKCTGYTYKEIFGEKLKNVKVTDYNGDYYSIVFEKVKKGETWTDKIQCLKKDGELYWEQLSVSPMYDESGTVTHAILVGNDITSELKTQQKLIDADKLSAIGLLAAGVAHEFKNYLGGIIGYATYAQSSLESKNSKTVIEDSLKEIVNIGERANEVSMSLLTYSRVKPNIMTNHNLKSVVIRTIELFSKELKSSQIQLETAIDDFPNIKMSPGRIQQVILNLLINARDAIERHGNIKVILNQNEGHAVLTISDNGVGIAADNISKIFDPFYSTKGVWGKDKIVGTGMGLSVSRNIAREHGGDLTVESKEGRGSTFTLTLPIQSDEYESDEMVGQTELSGECKELVVISMNKDVTESYTIQVEKFGCNVTNVETIDELKTRIENSVNLVLADAQFAAKVSLHNMIEECKNHGLPFIMINCGAMEYQLNDLYESAIAVYRECPDINQIAMQYRANQLLKRENQAKL